ncbi:L-2-hydroxyglutarate oxidase [Intrasporangium sp. YIM S08009]|uniref:L-2-hydroxyglutarate oxidase n=1 Tax=Intrasporangium zincisolvens TaxID=3080018 RepID=UPI002B05FFE7|nr:L-2-hydroxyglutarate oxidase [Intrasporangium sp. YIM S08009]
MTAGPARSRVVVVGAGIVGAAVARRLTRPGPGGTVPEVTVLEKEAEPGTHQTGHNSGVVHAGVYYAPGSDKARLSREGVRRLSAYCRERGLPYDELGKVVVALDADEEVRLRELERRASANGVPGLQRLGPDGLRDVEPHVTGRAALLSPTTAVTDFGAVARAFLSDASDAGAQVLTRFEVVDVRRRDSGPVRLTAADGRGVTADVVVVAAGLGADRLAALAGDGPEPRIVPFRGEYLRLRPEARHLVRGLVYPVPDPRYPFLGVHLTRRTDGEVLLGPNAVLATAREGYRRGDVDASQLRELVASPGFRRFARANVRTGLHEVAGSLSRRTYVGRVRRYVPELSQSDVLPAPAGVRAQAMDGDGSLVEDFRFSRVGAVFCIRNAPSPAATASLAIADLVVDRLELA